MAEGNSYDRILSDKKENESFCSWFWSGTNGNKLIHALNSNNSKSSGSKIRRLHNWWPHIYCIVLNDNANPGKGANGVQWKYCKVGITERNTATGSHNRMETVKSEIESKTGKIASILFVLPVKADDSRANNEIEKGVREHVGWPVNTELARHHKFPVPTEWVITTQACIDYIVNEKAKPREAGCDTGFILGIPKFNRNVGDLPTNLKLLNGELVRQPQA